MVNLMNFELITAWINRFAQIQPTGFPNPTVSTSISAILRIVFAVSALLAVVFVAVGGLKYTLSNGDPQGTAKAKSTILYAVVGLIISVFAFSIIGFVSGQL